LPWVSGHVPIAAPYQIPTLRPRPRPPSWLGTRKIVQMIVDHVAYVVCIARLTAPVIDLPSMHPIVCPQSTEQRQDDAKEAEDPRSKPKWMEDVKKRGSGDPRQAAKPQVKLY